MAAVTLRILLKWRRLLRRPQGPSLNVFIDVDYTLIAANGSLRPHARELFLRLRDAGHAAYVWSGMGDRRPEMEKHGLDRWVADYLTKPLENVQAALKRSAPPAWPDLVVDDHSEIVSVFGGISVRPYFFTDERDRELRRAGDALLAYAATGRCDDPAFTPPPRERLRTPA